MMHRVRADSLSHWRSALLLTLASLLVAESGVAQEATLAPGIRFVSSAVNRVLVEDGDRRLAVYGAPAGDTDGVEMVLVAQGRRDTVCAALPLVETTAHIVAPARDMYWLAQPDDFWAGFVTGRFHDYGQQSTKVLDRPLRVDQWVRDGDVVSWRGRDFQVIETPGYTRGAATYLLETGDQRIAFTGDLIYGDGQILDLYSFQDAIPEAQIRGYHGYGSRLADLVTSLRKVAAARPDVIVPSRGPVIRDPSQAIARLLERVQAVYRNYLSTNALHWYFKEPRMTICGRRVLGPDAYVQLMTYARHEKTPNWIYENSTSRMLISESGHGFLLDCGYPRVIEAIKELQARQVVRQVEGLFVTHFHDDHTDAVQAAADEFACPVYATPAYADVLNHPAAYHLPAMTANPVSTVTTMAHGESLEWREFKLTFYDYPGQTYYHGALLVEKAGAKPVFFVGDSFAPSGIDDYCVQNRNLLHDDQGYLRCLSQVGQLGDVWLVNEHIPHVFAFSTDELDYLQARYRERVAMLSELFPWDDPNYGVDEQWAVFYPYGVQAARGDELEFEVRLTNHSAQPRSFEIVPHVDAGLELLDCQPPVTIQPRQTGSVRLRVRVGELAGTRLVTADVLSPGMHFERWVEAMVTVDP